MPSQLSTIRIAVADDHPIFRDGVLGLLKTQPDLETAGEAADGVDAVRLVREQQPDILLLDLSMPRLGGLDVLRELAGASVKVILFAADISRDTTIEALRCGARGVLLKDCSPTLLLKCIRCVAQGEHWVGREVVADLVNAMTEHEPGPTPARRPFGLTARESEVLQLVVAGCTNRDIARQFNISTDTVKHHVTNIFDKTGVSNRLELALLAIHRSLV